MKVLDLGLARFVDNRQDELTKNLGDGCLLGTADYVSPEQALSTHDADVRSDVYSLGGTLYFLLGGRAPFEGTSMTQKLMAAQLRQPEPPTALRPDVPPGVAALVARMMEKAPERRYQAPAEVHAALKRGGARAPAEGVVAPSEVLRARRRRARRSDRRAWVIAIAVATVVVGVAAVGAWLAL